MRRSGCPFRGGAEVLSVPLWVRFRHIESALDGLGPHWVRFRSALSPLSGSYRRATAERCDHRARATIGRWG